MVLTISCGQHWDDFVKGVQDSLNFASLTKDNLLQNSRLGFAASTEEGVPSGNADVIKGVQINGSALTGGSTSITVTSSEELEELYLQIGDEAGYYRWILEDEDLISSSSDGYVYFVVLEFNRNLGDEGELIPFVVSGKMKNGKITVEKEKELEVKKAISGKMQISVSWDMLDDVDLYVYRPSSREPLYFGNKRSEDGKDSLDIDSNLNCEIDDPVINSENIYFENLEDGDYKVEVHLFRKCDDYHTDSRRSIDGEGARFYVTANIGGKFVTFSKQQNGKFDKTDYEDVFKVIGTIKIKDEACVNCTN